MMTKAEAQAALSSGRVRELWSISGVPEARNGYLPGEAVYSWLKQAKDPNKTFIAYDANSVGIYEVIG